MNQFRFNILAATVIAGAGLAFLTLPASAQSVTKTCSTQYQAAKEAGTLKGQKWPDFLSACSAKLKTDDGAAAAAPAEKTPAKKTAKETATKPAKTTQTAAAAASGGMSAKAVTKECSTQYQAAKERGHTQWPEVAAVPFGLQRQSEVGQFGCRRFLTSQHPPRLLPANNEDTGGQGSRPPPTASLCLRLRSHSAHASANAAISGSRQRQATKPAA